MLDLFFLAYLILTRRLPWGLLPYGLVSLITQPLLPLDKTSLNHQSVCMFPELDRSPISLLLIVGSVLCYQYVLQQC